MNGMFPVNHSNSVVEVGNATVFFSFVFEGLRAILAHLLNMCLCEYFYFESEINKTLTFWNVTRASDVFSYPKISWETCQSIWCKIVCNFLDEKENLFLNEWMNALLWNFNAVSKKYQT